MQHTLQGQLGRQADESDAVRREYPALLGAEQLGAVAAHYLRDCQHAWKPNPDREYLDPDKDLVYEMQFADEFSDAQADDVRTALGIGADEAIYVLWDKKLSSLFKTTYESLVLCDSGVYYRTGKKAGRLSWEEFRALPARAIRGGGNTLMLDGMSFRCHDAGAFMMVLQRLRSELVYARNWPNRDELTFEAPGSEEMRASASKRAIDFLRSKASGSAVHTSMEFDDANDFASDVRGYLDMPEDEAVYAGYEWSHDSDNPFPETNKELPASFGAFAFAQSGFYVCLDDGCKKTHTRLIGWDEFVEVMARDYAPSPDGLNSLVIDGTLFGNLGEGVNLYPRLIAELSDELKRLQ